MIRYEVSGKEYTYKGKQVAFSIWEAIEIAAEEYAETLPKDQLHVEPLFRVSFVNERGDQVVGVARVEIHRYGSGFSIFVGNINKEGE